MLKLMRRIRRVRPVRASRSAFTGFRFLREVIRFFDFRRAPSGSALTIGGCAGCSATVLSAGSFPVSEPAGGAFYLFDQLVRALGAGVGDAGREEYLDRW